MIDLIGLGYIMWNLFSTVLLITNVVYFITREGLRNPKILWWINIFLIITSIIILGLLTNWGYWRGAAAQETGGLGEPGEAFGSIVTMLMFWVPVFFYLLDLILLLIFRPRKNLGKKNKIQGETLRYL